MRPTLILLATLLVGCDAIGQFHPNSFPKQKFGGGFHQGIGPHDSGYPTVPPFGSHKDHEIIIRKKKSKMVTCTGINGKKTLHGAIAINWKEQHEKHESSYQSPFYSSLLGQSLHGQKKLEMKIHAMSAYDGKIAIIIATHGYVDDVCYGHDFGKGLQANKKHANGYGSQSHLYGSSFKNPFVLQQRFSQFGRSNFGGVPGGAFPFVGSSFSQFSPLSPHAFSHSFSSGKKEKKLPEGVLTLMDFQKYNVKTVVTNVKHFSELKEIAGHPIFACPYELLGEDYDGRAICKMEKDEISDFCCMPHYDKHERTIYKDKDHIAIKKVITDEYHDDSHH